MHSQQPAPKLSYMSVASAFLATAILGAGLMASAAWAHTSYILPNVFSTISARMVSAEASFTEDFFKAEIAVKSDDYHVVRPDGSRNDFDMLAVHTQLVHLEEALDMEGTYLLTTGQRAGRKSQMMRTENGWEPLAREEGNEGGDVIIPEGAIIDAFQTLTVADAYVTKGAPTRTVLRTGNTGLEIRPITHPSEIYLDSGFDLQLAFNGAPLAAQDITIYRAGGAYDEPKFKRTARTDADGRASINFSQPGIYLIMTRHRAAAPDGAETPWRSYTTSLTFEVVR